MRTKLLTFPYFSVNFSPLPCLLLHFCCITIWICTVRYGKENPSAECRNKQPSVAPFLLISSSCPGIAFYTSLVVWVIANSIVIFGRVWYSVMLYGLVWNGMVRYSMVWKYGGPGIVLCNLMHFTSQPEQLQSGI